MVRRDAGTEAGVGQIVAHRQPCRKHMVNPAAFARNLPVTVLSGGLIVGCVNTLAYVTYGTKRKNAYAIIEDSLNLRDCRVYDTIHDADGTEKRVLNTKETMLAQQKQEMVREAFKSWIWKAPERREVLCQKYNEIFNSMDR